MNASLQHLQGHLQILDERIRVGVARRRATDPEPDDPVRGLYISDQEVDTHLAGTRPSLTDILPDGRAAAAAVEAAATEAVARGEELRLRSLQESFALDDLDRDLLVTALAPDLDPRYERLYGYLQDDVTRRRAGIGLALELAGRSLFDVEARDRFAESGRLVSSGLLEIDEKSRPYGTRNLRVADRVALFLLGSDELPHALIDLVVERPVEVAPKSDYALTRAISEGLFPIYIEDRPGAAGLGRLVGALQACGRRAFVIDISRAGDGEELEAVKLAVREGRLRQSVLVVKHADKGAERELRLIRQLNSVSLNVAMIGRSSWDPRWCARLPLVVKSPLLSPCERQQMWRRELADENAESIAHALTPFRLDPDQTHAAVDAAWRTAISTQSNVNVSMLRHGARLQNLAGLDRLARRIEPEATLDDVVLPDRAIQALSEIIRRATYQDKVILEWGMGGAGRRGRGVTALFAGESGTGKTLSAEVVAAAMGLDLYSVELSTVVDKYIGETEKNLDRLFEEAEGANGVLFFDEADALFGRRSSVSDARDRYANVEVAHLLQRMETFEGIAILATNFRSNLDDAFNRRLDVIVEFPTPNVDARRRIWELHLPAAAPTAGELDLDRLAGFDLSGGNIRNVAMAAAFAAAAQGEEITVGHVNEAIASEYRKIGRVLPVSELGALDDAKSPKTD